MSRAKVDISCFSDVLLKRAVSHPERDGLAIVGTDGHEKLRLTYRELSEQVEAYAAGLVECGLAGKRVLMLFEPGAGFVVAFLACLRAGVVAVPCHLAKPGRSTWDRLVSIARDSNAACILTECASASKIKGWLADSVELSTLPLFTEDDFKRASTQVSWNSPSKSTPAFLQYTSGSTGSPKGTVVTFGNLFAHATMLGPLCDFGPHATVVSWLPPYHDLGLIGNILQALFDGAFCVLLPPVSLIQNPRRWLEAITTYKATISMAPNFAYELCVRRIPQDKREGLDLSSWTTALNGAEPIRASTLVSFTEAYAPYGFRPETFRPAYGLAEATLVVAISQQNTPPKTVTVDSAALDNGHIVRSTAEGSRAIASSGKVRAPQRVAIVNPDNYSPCVDGMIGEIWIGGPCIADGYWEKPELSIAQFQAYTADGTGPFLRTGDLGTIIDDELFVTGRMKEVMIIRGRNIYPQDIEATVQQSHDAFRPAGGAVFAFEDAEGVVIVQEVERSRIADEDHQALIAHISQAVVEAHGVAVLDVILVKPEVVPKTSSGKIQRVLCRQLYLGDTIPYVIARRSKQKAVSGVPATPARPAVAINSQVENSSSSASKAEEMKDWLRHYAPKRINSALMDARRSTPPHIMLDFGNHGLLGMDCPEHLGGRGLALADTLQVIQQLGAIDLTLANVVILHNSLGLRPLLTGASKELCASIVPAIASGRELIAFALTEEAAGSNPRAMVSKAERADNGWSLNGRKIWIGNAGWAQHLNVFALTYDGMLKGISGFHVTTDQPGVVLGEEHMTMGLRSMVQNSVYFDDVHVNDAAVLGTVGKGMAVAQDAMTRTRLYIAASAVGGIKSVIGMMQAYSSQRNVSAGRLIQMPETQRKIWSAIADARALEVLVENISKPSATEHRAFAHVSAIAKVLGSERLWAALDDACQLTGGRSYMEPNGLAQMLRDARILRIFEGPSETLFDYVGAAFRSSGADLIEFVEKEIGDQRVGALLRELAVEWFQTRSSTATEDGFNLESGRVVGDAVLLAAGRVASLKHDLPVELLEERLHHRIERLKLLHKADMWRKSRSVDQILRLAQDCANDVALEKIDQPAEDWSINSYFRSKKAEFKNPQPDTTIEVVEPAEEIEIFDIKRMVKIIEDWMLSEELPLPENDEQSFAEFGIDSMRAVNLTYHLEASLGLELDETILWVFPTIRSLSEELVQRRASLTKTTRSSCEGNPNSAAEVYA